MAEILNVVNLSKYRFKRKIFENISFSLKPGEIVGLFGNGECGKSALADILAGCSSQSGGSFFVDGVEVISDMVEHKGKIGYLPSREALYCDMTVSGFMSFMFGIKKVKSDVNTHINEILDLLNLSEKKEKLIRCLSKDERKQLGLAAALAGNPDLLILDLPLSGVSSETADRFLKVIKEVGKAAVITFDSASEPKIAPICDKIIKMSSSETVDNEACQSSEPENQDSSDDSEAILEEEVDELIENQANEALMEDDILADNSKLEEEE